MQKYILKKEIKGIDTKVGEEFKPQKKLVGGIYGVRELPYDPATVALLEHAGFIERVDDTPKKWEAQIGETYWYICDRGHIDDCSWGNDSIDRNRKNFIGIFETKALAEAALEEIKSKWGKKYI